MKKIMFNDKYGLTDAVIEGRKTMTRRFLDYEKYKKTWDDMCRLGIPCFATFDDFLIKRTSRYQVGEVVAVAQSYLSLTDELQADKQWESRYDAWKPFRRFLFNGDDHTLDAGWKNKMFVKAELMRHAIQITDIKVERLQDISDEDCIYEGVTKSRFNDFPNEMYFPYKQCKDTEVCYTPRGAFQILIDRVSGKGTWEHNPFVFVYSFEIVK